MAGITTLRNGKVVLANLNREIMAMQNRTLRGMIMGAAIIRKDMEKTPPKTPVDYGNLKASFFTVTARSVNYGKSPNFKGEVAGKMAMDHTLTIGEIQGKTKAKSKAGMQILMLGYSANYALYVHEYLGLPDTPRWRYGPGPGKKRWYKPRPGAGPKWFEESFKRNEANVIQAIRLNARIKN